jgi:fibrillarin-like rRNA methylase
VRIGEHDSISAYKTEDYQSRIVHFERNELIVMIRGAAYRFYNSQRRNPAAIVMCRHLALQLSSVDQMLFPNVSYHGVFALDDVTTVPLLGRPGDLDPIFQFL